MIASSEKGQTRISRIHLALPRQACHTMPPMRICQQIIAALAALVILITGHASAVARAMPGASGQIEICAHGGPVMIYVDETGQPTAPPHLCPDWAATWADPDMPVTAPPRKSAPYALRWSALRPALAPAQPVHSAWARGPPLEI